MNRLQNLILTLWGVALLLFIAFNWSLINRVVDITYLFMDFQVRVLMWLSVLGFGVPLALRLMGSFSLRTTQRKTEKEISAIKSKAYDGLSSEFTRLGEKLEGQLNNQLQSIAKAQTPVSDPAPSEIKDEEEGGKTNGKKDKKEAS